MIATKKAPLLGLGALALAGLGGLVYARTSGDRPDCPGKTECPITGELVCKDRCSADGMKDALPSCCEDRR